MKLDNSVADFGGVFFKRAVLFEKNVSLTFNDCSVSWDKSRIGCYLARKL
jgi:hypothetical protein